MNIKRTIFFTLILPIVILASLYLLIVGYIVLSYIFLSCTGQYGPIETPIQQTPFTVNEQGVVFEFDPPLKRLRNGASVRIALEGTWETNPPWDVVEFADGRKAAIKVVLTSVEDKTYPSTILGNGKMLDVRFDLPKSKIAIKKVTMTSDIPVQCENATWYDFQYF